jgi:hypothetical protein
MKRYILRYTGTTSAPADHVASILATPGTTVVDRSPKMLLVDGEEPALRKTLKSMPEWSLHSEQTLSLPDTRKRIG